MSIPAARWLMRFVVLASSAMAHAAEVEVLDVAGALARPLMIVTPVYPGSAAKAKVQVRVTGRVTAQGRLVAPVLVADPGDEPFAAAVREVLELWRFIPAVAVDSCRPKEEEATMFVWFEKRDGAPRVFVSMPQDEGANAKRAARAILKRRHQHRIDFPSSPLRRGIEGTVHALLSVGSTGEVLDVQVRAMAPLNDFGSPVLRGLRRWEFEPFDPAAWNGKRAICAEYEVNFCIPSGADREIESPRCAASRAKPPS